VAFSSGDCLKNNVGFHTLNLFPLLVAVVYVEAGNTVKADDLKTEVNPRNEMPCKRNTPDILNRV
jgi:hypothetical protein